MKFGRNGNFICFFKKYEVLIDVVKIYYYIVGNNWDLIYFILLEFGFIFFLGVNNFLVVILRVKLICVILVVWGILFISFLIFFLL